MFVQDIPPATPERVRIFDTTLRDGEQTPGVHFRPETKLEIAKALETFGVDTIEAGFPASSPGDAQAVAAVSQYVRRCEVAALARCMRADAAAAADALADAEHPVLHVVLGVSDVHLEHKMEIGRADALRIVRDVVAYARSRVATVQFSCEDATRTERPFLRQVITTAIEAGASRINIADTVGCALPHEFGALIADVVRTAGEDVIVSAHCHNDMGLATANSVEAIRRGARQVEATINGIGERAGNAAIEEIGVICAKKGIASTGLDLPRVAALSALVSRATGVPVQPNRAVVGANAFAHSSGIHQAGILKRRETYEFVAPEEVGVSGHRFILTARSGRGAVAHVAACMGHQLDGAMLNRVYTAFLRAADAAEGAISECDLRTIIQHVEAAQACPV